MMSSIGSVLQKRVKGGFDVLSLIGLESLGQAAERLAKGQATASRLDVDGALAVAQVDSDLFALRADELVEVGAFGGESDLGHGFVSVAPVLTLIAQRVNTCNIPSRFPLDLIGPVSRAHLALGDVLGVPGLERCALLSALVGLSALLSKANGLDLVAFLGHHDMTLGLMARCALGLVVTAYACLIEAWIFLFSHYFLPRFLAWFAFAAFRAVFQDLALGAPFCPGLRGFLPDA